MAHRSFGFVFHQLKCYYDLLTILKMAEFRPLAVERAREEDRHLKEHF